MTIPLLFNSTSIQSKFIGSPLDNDSDLIPKILFDFYFLNKPNDGLKRIATNSLSYKKYCDAAL